ncbi:S1C family serine protease [Nocardiopsis listeri]|uniref:S1C family serine protease n=1 Tax=Nocardiopsis listeri TaxID=53440 RepID=UPI0008379205|nr:trypsin-like peptidase domain-containing protein [Nocardiopsis listeri]
MQPHETNDGHESGAGTEHTAGAEDHPVQDSFASEDRDQSATAGDPAPVNETAPETSEALEAAAASEAPEASGVHEAERSGAPRFSPPEETGPRWATEPQGTGHGSYAFHGQGPHTGPHQGGPRPGPGMPPPQPQPQPQPQQQQPHSQQPPQGHYGAGPNNGAFAAPGQPGPAGPPHQTAAFAAGGHPGGPRPPGPFGQPHFGPPPESERKKRGTGKIVGIAAVTALVTSLIIGPAAALGTAFLVPGADPISALDGRQGSTATEGAVGEVAEQVLPSVVSIQTGSGGGSGVILSSDGQILTNAHVVAEAENGPLQVRFNDGSAAEAELLGVDPVSDIAVIQAEGRDDLTPATLGDSDQVGVGGDVVAIGSPLGLSGTVTTGVVSALNRPVNTGATESGDGQTSTVINAIQTDAAINPGNSGGPLVNMAGEVVGINTAIAGLSQESGSVGLGFAIPINQVRPIAEQLVEEGSASYPAIQATIAPSRSGGAEIMEVTDGGAAADAGLSTGDVVVSLDGEAVDSPDQLIAQIRAHAPGDEVTLGVVPKGEDTPEDVTVTLSEQSAASATEEIEEED